MLEQIYNKLKDKFFNKFKKPYIPPILANFPISLFFKKNPVCHAQLHMGF